MNPLESLLSDAPSRAKEAEVYLSPAELADFLNIPIATVYRMNVDGKAPTRVKFGNHVRYPMSKVLEWLEARTILATDD